MPGCRIDHTGRSIERIGAQDISIRKSGIAACIQRSSCNTYFKRGASRSIPHIPFELYGTRAVLHDRRSRDR